MIICALIYTFLMQLPQTYASLKKNLSSASGAPALGGKVDGRWRRGSRRGILVFVESVWSFVLGIVGLHCIKIESDVFTKGGGSNKWR